MKNNVIVSSNAIERKIYLIRGERVMIDGHLAELYHVPTKVLIQAVKRNIKRFPPEFMFQLTKEEFESLRSQIVTSKAGRGGRRYLPYAFTEHGVAMLSSILSSDRAIEINILIIKTFIKLREILSTHKELAQKLAIHEMKIEKHDEQIENIFEAIRLLLQPPEKPKRQIGFRVEEPKVKYSVRRKR